jgi:hypothetical protein
MTRPNQYEYWAYLGLDSDVSLMWFGRGPSGCNMAFRIGLILWWRLHRSQTHS